MFKKLIMAMTMSSLRAVRYCQQWGDPEIICNAAGPTPPQGDTCSECKQPSLAEIERVCTVTTGFGTDPKYRYSDSAHTQLN